MHTPDQQQLSRRSFHRRALAGVGSATAGMVWSSSMADAGRNKSFPKGRYVDMHTHLGQTWNSTEMLSAEDLLRWMDASDVAQAIVLPLISPESSSYPLTTDFVLAETQRHRDRLIPFCSVDPRTSYKGGLKGLVAMLEKYVEAGAKGFGEHKPGIAIDDERNMTVYAACGEVGLPVLFHLDNQRNTDVPGLPGLAKALEQNPKTHFIGHGPGWWASISGGLGQDGLGAYPKGKVQSGGAIDALMEKYPNIHGDLSAGSGANAISRDMEFGREFLIRRADRLMFGTDFLTPGQDIPQLDLYGSIDLPADVEAKVYRDNARSLLGLG